MMTPLCVTVRVYGDDMTCTPELTSVEFTVILYPFSGTGKTSLQVTRMVLTPVCLASKFIGAGPIKHTIAVLTA